MTYIIRIETDNAAFSDGWAGMEIARILTLLSERNTNNTPLWDGPLVDYNGHRVGEARIEE